MGACRDAVEARKNNCDADVLWIVPMSRVCVAGYVGNMHIAREADAGHRHDPQHENISMMRPLEIIEDQLGC